MLPIRPRIFGINVSALALPGRRFALNLSFRRNGISSDVSIQAQILNMFKDLQEQLNLAYLFIAHDILVVNYMSDQVMYLGKIIEMAETNDIVQNATHPYTQSLLSAVPIPGSRQPKKQTYNIKGDVPSPIIYRPAARSVPAAR